MVKTSASESVSLKLVFTAFLFDIEKDSVENKPASLLVVALEKARSGIPHFKVVDRWLANLSELVIALRSLSRDRKMNNIQLIQHCIL